MTAPELLPFDTRAAFQAHLGDVLARARATLVMFDPDFVLFRLGAQLESARPWIGRRPQVVARA